MLTHSDNATGSLRRVTQAGADTPTFNGIWGPETAQIVRDIRVKKLKQKNENQRQTNGQSSSEFQ